MFSLIHLTSLVVDRWLSGRIWRTSFAFPVLKLVSSVSRRPLPFRDVLPLWKVLATRFMERTADCFIKLNFLKLAYSFCSGMSTIHAKRRVECLSQFIDHVKIANDTMRLIAKARIWDLSPAILLERQALKGTASSYLEGNRRLPPVDALQNKSWKVLTASIIRREVSMLEQCVSFYCFYQKLHVNQKAVK